MPITPVNSQPVNQFDSWESAVRWLPVRNMENEPIPAYGVIGLDPGKDETASWNNTGGVIGKRDIGTFGRQGCTIDKADGQPYFRGFKPVQYHEDAQEAATILFNGPNPIQPGSIGRATVDLPARALCLGDGNAETADKFSIAGVQIGPAAGQWGLSFTGSAFRLMSWDHLTSIRYRVNGAGGVVYVRANTSPAPRFWNRCQILTTDEIDASQSLLSAANVGAGKSSWATTYASGAIDWSSDSEPFGPTIPSSGVYHLTFSATAWNNSGEQGGAAAVDMRIVYGRSSHSIATAFRTTQLEINQYGATINTSRENISVQMTYPIRAGSKIAIFSLYDRLRVTNAFFSIHEVIPGWPRVMLDTVFDPVALGLSSTATGSSSGGATSSAPSSASDLQEVSIDAPAAPAP